MSISDLINRARVEPPYMPRHYSPLAPVICKVNDPVPWDRNEIERELGFKIHDDIVALWEGCGGMVLCQEPQWGLVVLSPLEAVAKQREYLYDRGEDAMSGDLIFARFWGDGRLALIRSDIDAKDYGTIMIVAVMDDRADWYTPARTLEEFFVRYMDTHGDDYWDVHYKEILADRAAKIKGRLN